MFRITMKKYLAFFVAMLMSLSIATVFAEDGDFTVTVKSTEAMPGDRVDVDFVLENNPGVIAIILAMDYDETRLKLVDAKDGGLLEGAVFGDDYAKKPFKFVWASASHDNFSDDGTLVTVTFEVAMDAPEGDAYIRLAHNAKNIINVNNEKIPLTDVSGYIKVRSKGTGISGENHGENAAIGEEKELAFSDVKKTAWYYPGVKFACEKAWMSGVDSETFAPMSNLTRGMLVSILYRMEGSPECKAPEFADVLPDAWYAKGIGWAAEKGIANGVREGVFEPDGDITREQIATILYGYSKYLGKDTEASSELTGFSDYGEISSWANTSMRWAVGKGLISGKDGGLLDPKGKATRAEIATILMNFSENM